MTIRKYKPTTNGQRNMTSLDLAEITKRKSKRALLESQSHTAGRNSYGYITVRHRDGGHKQKYHIIDFKRSKDDVRAVVEAIEYDPNRTTNTTLPHYTDGIRVYILAPEDLKIDDVVESGVKTDIKPGNALPLINIPIGISIHNVELKPGEDGQLVRSAGTESRILDTGGHYTLVRLQSGEVRHTLSACRATVGVVGNEQHSLIQLGKAGRKCRLGKRPQSCGSVMDPNDHPYGGSEGKAPVGRPQPMTPWGKKSRGIKTGNTEKTSEKMIIHHRKDNK